MPVIPLWIARLVLVIMAPIGAGAIWLTRKYASASIEFLAEHDRLVRQLSIDVLLAAHIALVIVVALLPAKQFRALRVALAILSLGIWAFDGVGMYGARAGIMQKADTTLTSAADRYANKQRTMKDLQASAAARRAQADREWVNRRWTDAKAGRDLASKESAQATRLQAELDTMPDGSGTSEVRVFGGERNAFLRAAAEALLISLVLVASCVLVGLMLRVLLQDSAQRRALEWPDPVKRPAPAPVTAEEVARALKFRPRQAGNALVTHDDDEPTPAPVTPAPAPVAPEPITPVQVQITPAQVRKKQVQKRFAAGAKIAPVQVQGGVKKHLPDGLRKAIESGPKNGGISPAQIPVRKFTGCNQDTAIHWLDVLGREGVLIRKGDRWTLNPARKAKV